MLRAGTAFDPFLKTRPHFLIPFNARSQDIVAYFLKREVAASRINSQPSNLDGIQVLLM